MKAIAIKPAWIASMIQPPQSDGWIVVQDGIIQEIVDRCPEGIESRFRYELPDWAVLPGLFNSHCHLEFSNMSAPLPAADSFVDWIRSVIQHRVSEMSSDPERQRRDAIQAGMREAWETGTRFLLDTVTAPWNPVWIDEGQRQIRERLHPNSEILLGSSAPIQVEPCVEVIDINQTRRRETLEHLETIARQFATTHVAPHAPYTASSTLVRDMAQWANEHQGVISFHLAESNDEMEWLSRGSGPFESALRGFRDDQFMANRTGIGIYLDSLQVACRVLIAHGNHFQDETLDRFAKGDNETFLVHCPRTYDHFRREGQGEYPMANRLARGIKHFLGTDSRASNPDLSIWSEFCELAHRHREIPMDTMLAMITREPAIFFGQGSQGTIAAGQRALLTAVSQSNLRSNTSSKLASLVGSVAKPLELVLFRRTLFDF
jgi:aminodeoxyfutalosine deaminase